MIVEHDCDVTGDTDQNLAAAIPLVNPLSAARCASVCCEVAPGHALTLSRREKASAQRRRGKRVTHILRLEPEPPGILRYLLEDIGAK